jgi:competence protein ComEA
MDLPQFLGVKKTQLAVGLSGFFLLIAGVVMAVGLGFGENDPEVKILSVDEKNETGSEVVVDVEGAVEKPGVYKLALNSRIQDAITVAGGYGQEADRDWIARYFNLAQPLVDGSKIYIPAVGETVDLPVAGPAGAASDGMDGEAVGIAGSGSININSASSNELESLWGIGEARAKMIIENRPYQTIEELVDKKVIPTNVFEAIKNKISVY